MLLVAAVLAALILYIIQMKVYEKHTFRNINYDIRISANEVFEGEDLFLYEEITNQKSLSIPYIRFDSTLPSGLQFTLSDYDKRKGKIDVYESYVQSVFVVKGYQKIRRRWRVNCQKRGVYRIGYVTAVSNDLFGFNAKSTSFEAPESNHNQVVVLPKAIQLDEHFTSSRYHSGEAIVQRSLITDPLFIAGSREYTPYDPMNRINWNSTAAHGKLMVNVEEYTEQYQFNLILNMQSRSVEQNFKTPSSPEFVELGITVCASILDQISSQNIPVRLFANAPPECAGQDAVGDDAIGSTILVTKPFKGRRDILNALRILAALEMKISCPFNQMLDHITENPTYYAGGGNIIVVSSFIDERMVVFHDNLQKRGIKVIFYITTSNQNTTLVPNHIDVYYKTFR